MKNKKVSVIIPCYNCEKYLEEGIKSILDQSYKNIELIIVDDGSTDKSIEIANNYLGKGKLRLIQQEHCGVSAARNLGIKKSTGDYIFFMDADDTLNKRCIEKLVEYADKENAEMVIIRQPNKFTGKPESINNTYSIKRFSGTEAAIEMLSYKIVIASWGRLYDRRFLLEKNIEFDTSLRYGEGFNFSIEAMLASSNVVITNEELYNYRVDSITSVMSTLKPGMIENSFKAIDRIERITPKNELFGNAVNYARFHTACDMLNTVIAIKIKKQSEKPKIYSIIKNTKFDNKKLNLSKKERIKNRLYRLCPSITSLAINKIRKRKYYAS